MCMFKPDVPEPKDPVIPPEMAPSRLPDGEDVRRNVNARQGDKMRAAGSILTSGSGVTQQATTEKKTLLGA